MSRRAISSRASRVLWMACLALLAAAVLVPAAGSVAATESSTPAVGTARGTDAESTMSAAERAHRQAQRAARRSDADGPRARTPSLIRIGLGAAGMGLGCWGLWLRRRGRETHPRQERARLALLVVVALVAFASYYHFFRLTHASGFATTDNFHYFVGSKYTAELGYFGLYECSLVALAERRKLEFAPGQQARELRSMEVVPIDVVLRSGRDCPERFGPTRWQAFGDDVTWFVKRWSPRLQRHVWSDYGYHPSPVWGLLGGIVSSNVDVADAEAAFGLSRADRYVVGAAFLMVGAVFGIEVAALAAILWGAGYPWRYEFVGDAFFRHVWWFAALFGVCALRRGWYAAGGAAFGLSTLVRIFPGALPFGLLLRLGQAAWQERRIPSRLVRFCVGAGIAIAALVGATVATSGRGVAIFGDFVEKITAFTALPATNRVGLDVVRFWVFGDSALLGGAFQLACVCVFALLFWRGVRSARDWEAAAMGFAIIPVLSAPTNYYYSFLVVGMLLAARRPVIGLQLLAGGVAFSVIGLFYQRTYEEYFYASIVAVVVVFAVVFEMTRPAPVGPHESSLEDANG